MQVVDLAIPLCWIAFWVYWLVASTGVKQAARTRSSGFVGARVALVVLVVLGLRTGLFRGHSLTVRSPVLQGVGVALFVAGLALAVWARRYLGRNWGMPMTEKVDPELVTTGPYRLIRHPIYSGIILAMIGTAIAVSPYWLAAAVVLGGYFVYSATVEERIMASHFPDTYPAYKRSTKRLVPFVF